MTDSDLKAMPWWLVEWNLRRIRRMRLKVEVALWCFEHRRWRASSAIGKRRANTRVG